MHNTFSFFTWFFKKFPMFLKGSNIISTSSLCENRMAQSALYVINVVLGELSREKFPLVKLPRGKFPIVNPPPPPHPPSSADFSPRKTPLYLLVHFLYIICSKWSVNLSSHRIKFSFACFLKSSLLHWALRICLNCESVHS